MSENVTIDNIKFSGQGGKMPMWSTEKTMQAMHEEVKNLARVLLKKTGGSKSDSSLTKSQKELIAAFEKLDDASESVAAKAAKLGDIFEDTGKSADEASKDLSENMKSTGGMLSGLKSPIGGATGMFQKLKSPMGMAITGFGAIGAGIFQLVNGLVEMTDTFFDLYNSGVTFEQGLFELKLAAGQAAMPLDDFAKTLLESSAVVKSFGKNGAVVYANILRQTRELTMSQGMFGMSLEQVNSLTSDYMESQRMRGLLEGQTQAQLAQRNAEYLENLTLFSQAIGKSREEIAAETQAITTRADVFAFFNTLPEQTRQHASKIFEQASAGIAGLFKESSEDVNTLLADIIVEPSRALQSDLFKSLLATNNKAAKQLLRFGENIGRGAMTTDQVNEELANIVVSLKNTGQAGSETLRTFTRFDNQLKEGAMTQARILQDVASIGDDSLKMLRDGTKTELDETSKSIQTFRELFRTIFGKLSEFQAEFFLNNKGTIDKFMSTISERAVEFTEVVKDLFDIAIKLLDPDTREQTWNDITAKISEVLGEFVDRLLNSIGQSIDETINPFSRSTSQRRAQEEASKRLDQEYAKIIESEDKALSDRAKHVKGVLKGLLENEDFVDDIDSVDTDTLKKTFNQILDANEDLGVDFSKILQPILSADEDFREIYQEILKERAGRMQAKTFFETGDMSAFKSDLGDKPVTAPNISAENQRNQISLIQNRPTVAGVGPRSFANRNRNDMITSELTRAPEIAESSNNNQAIKEMADQMKKMVEVSEKTAMHTESMVNAQMKTTNATKETARQIKINGNTIR